jgi:hypothetical protein
VKYVPSAIAGSVMCASHSRSVSTNDAGPTNAAATSTAATARPLVWKMPSWTANTRISMIPSQKFGVEIPANENSVASQSTGWLRRVAETTPNGIDSPIATTVAATASSTVAGSFENTSVVTSCPRTYEKPMRHEVVAVLDVQRLVQPEFAGDRLPGLPVGVQRRDGVDRAPGGDEPQQEHDRDDSPDHPDALEHPLGDEPSLGH